MKMDSNKLIIVRSLKKINKYNLCSDVCFLEISIEKVNLRLSNIILNIPKAIHLLQKIV